MRVDVHAHYWTDDYLDLVAGLGHTDTGTQRGLGAGDGNELDARLRLMDRAGVDGRYCRPDRFRAFAATPMPHVAESVTELGRALDGHVPALRCAIDSFGAGRLLLGTDFPYETGDTYVRAVDYITDPRITEQESSAILEGNATALFGMTSSTGA